MGEHDFWQVQIKAEKDVQDRKRIDGSRGRTRTYDQAVNSRPLYHWATREYRAWLLRPVPKLLLEKRELIPALQQLFVFYLSIAV